MGQHLCLQKWVLTKGTTMVTNGLSPAAWRLVETQSAAEIRLASPTGLCQRSGRAVCVQPRSAWHLSLTLWLRPFAQRLAPLAPQSQGLSWAAEVAGIWALGTLAQSCQRFCWAGRKGAPRGASTAPGAGGFFHLLTMADDTA